MTTAAVIGCGDVSVVHLEAIQALDDVTLVAVCDTDVEAGSATGATYGVPVFTDHRELIATLRPDVVHVCTPHDQHADPVVDALEAGVDVIMEKPVAHSLSEARRVVAAAQEHPNRRIAVCLQNRYNPTIRYAKDLIDSGETGRVVGASATLLWHRAPAYYDAKPWRGQRVRSGGGVLINQAIHTLDLLQWLVGPVTWADGLAGTFALGAVVDVEDTAQVVLDHIGGSRSVFFATVAYAIDAPVTLQIVTDRALLDVCGDLTVRWEDGRVETVPERRAQSAGRAYWGASHQLLIADFYRTRDESAPFWIGPTQALPAMEILTTVYQRSGLV